MATTELNIPLTFRDSDRHGQWNCQVGDVDTLMVLAQFASHVLTTMMLAVQMNCEDCDGLETARVSKIDTLHLHTQWPWLHVEFGECSQVVTMP